MADPVAGGNQGLDGYDEETDSSDRLASADDARAWCEAWMIDDGVQIETALVYSGSWAPIEYNDRHRNTVPDAEPAETHCRQGIRTDLGWVWSDRERRLPPVELRRLRI